MISSELRSWLRSWSWWKTGVVLLLLFFGMQMFWGLEARLPENATQIVSRGPGGYNQTKVQIASTTMALSPGELPGYTGWARPERTLAKHFSIVSVSTLQPKRGQMFYVTVQCKGSEACYKGTSLFYLRAYGPSVIPGLVKNTEKGQYVMSFLPSDPGSYTVEVVLTFSDPPSLENFPLTGQAEPAYEGYLLPGFPLQLVVHGDTAADIGSDVLCNSSVLFETSSESAFSKARWKVVSKSNGPGYTSETMDFPVSESGYKHNIHSLGMHMDYEYVSACKILSQSAFAKRLGSYHPFAHCGKNMQVIFIGDSTMRVQVEMFKGLVGHLPNVQLSYVNLYGGYRRVEKFGTSIQVFLEDIQRRFPNDSKAILFNTGLHDIHRLCGNEWTDDRYEYLDKEKLDSGTFSCIEEYRLLLTEFSETIRKSSGNIRIFQSTTAAWLKYGNFGIEWPYGIQVLPVSPEAIARFNEVAFDVLNAYREDIQILDGYWITYSRPDNREIGTLGSKLSHPGLEVQSAMVRIWAMAILEKVCNLR